MKRLLFVVVVSLLACSAQKVRTLVPIGGSCATANCTTGGICTNGICRSVCSADISCASSEICMSGACIPVVCGDGVINGSEECDDKNMASNDGCSSSCRVEFQFACVGEPSQCVPCTDPDPLNCTLAFSYTAWGDWRECSAECGTGTQFRTRDCRRSDGTNIDCAYCGGQCDEEQSCTAPQACPPSYTAWSDWSTCTNNMQSRTRTCESSGSEVDCSGCGGECTESRACLPCGYGVNIVNCSPSVPGDQAACEASLGESRDRCIEGGCTWSGPTACTVGGSSSTAGCYGATGACN